MVAVLVVVDDDGAVLVVALVVAALVAVLVSVDALVVDDADVSAVVELVVEPQAAIAASAAAAAKLKIKRMGSPPPGKWDEEPSALNLSAALAQSDNFESDARPGTAPSRQFAVASEGSVPLSGGRNQNA